MSDEADTKVSAQERASVPSKTGAPAPSPLSDAERASGYVRPYRNAVIHIRSAAVAATKTSAAIPEVRCPVTILRPDHAHAHARTPGLVATITCTACKQKRPAGEFVWNGTSERVGAK
jgi:hypothetical protein